MIINHHTVNTKNCSQFDTSETFIDPGLSKVIKPGRFEYSGRFITISETDDGTFLWDYSNGQYPLIICMLCVSDNPDIRSKSWSMIRQTYSTVYREIISGAYPEPPWLTTILLPPAGSDLPFCSIAGRISQQITTHLVHSYKE